MKKRNLLVAALLATTVLPLNYAMSAAVDVEASTGDAALVVHTAPPELRHEDMPPQPGDTYVWVRGYWSWKGRWVWVPGHWEVPQEGYSAWEPGTWVKVDGGWRWKTGRWTKTTVTTTRTTTHD